MTRTPVRRAMAPPTAAPAFTSSRIRGGHANPGPCPTAIRPERSTTAQYWTSKWSERTDDPPSPASMPTPKSPPPIADFARFIAPWTASSSNGWSETSVFTRTPRTRAGRESAWKTSFTARIFTGLFEPTDTCSGFRRFPRRSISPSRMRREAIGRPSSARTIGTVRMPSGRRPFAALASLRATATGWRSAETTSTSRSGKSSAGPYGSSIGSIRAWRHFLAARNRFRLRSRTAYGFTRGRDSFANRSVVRPMTTASGRPSKAARSRASCPACRRSNVPPRTTRIWRTIRSTRYKNDSGRQTALADREEVGVQRVSGLSQRRLALDDLKLPQHVRPHDEGARRAVHRRERVVERDGLQGYRGLHGPVIPPSAGAQLHTFACRPRRLDPFRRQGGDPLPRHPFRSKTASHQHVGEETRLHGRVPALEVHRRVRFEEAHVPGRLDSVLIRPAPLHHGENQVRRAVQDPLARLDPDATERLLKQVEHRGAVHHGPLVPEAESLREGQLFQASVMVDDRAFVRGDHMLAAREGRDDVVHADLPRADPQGRDLDHDVGPCPTDVLGRPSVDPAATGLQGGARVREPQRLP